jgi:hypothetical protein
VGPTALRLDVERRVSATFRVFAVGGRLVLSRSLGVLDRGSHTVTWDGRDGGSRRVAPGVYFGAVDADGRRVRTRFVLTK